MKPLDKIEKGIKTKSWGLVCEGYNAISGDSLDPPEDSDSGSDIIRQIRELVGVEATLEQAPNAKKEKQVKAVAAAPAASKSSGGVASAKMQNPFDEELDQKIANKKKNYKRKTIPRDPYVPNMQTCTNCTQKFDFNKTNPLGVLDSEALETIKCGKCRAKRK